MKRRRSLGFTLTELLIVVALIALLLVLFLMTGWRRQIDKGYDAKRKSDLATIKTVFEEYYNDHRCYPPVTILNNCGSGDLDPYLAKVPCDPVSKAPYLYIPLGGDACRGYRVMTKLSNTVDPDIARLGCHGDLYCGFGPGYNYGISSGTVVLAPGVPTPTPTPTPTPLPTATPTPTPTPPPTYYACSPQGICNVYSNPVSSGCPVTFDNPQCSNACDIVGNRCRR